MHSIPQHCAESKAPRGKGPRTKKQLVARARRVEIDRLADQARRVAAMEAEDE